MKFFPVVLQLTDYRRNHLPSALKFATARRAIGIGRRIAVNSSSLVVARDLGCKFLATENVWDDVLYQVELVLTQT